MKRISILWVTLALCATPLARAQDAATEERLNKLAGQIEDIIAGQKAMQKQIGDLSRDVDNLREQASKPVGNYASQEEAKRLAEAIKEVDRKRLEDYDKIRAELLKLSKVATQHTPTPKPSPSHTDTPVPPPGPQNVFEYVIQKNDSLSAIVQAYKEKNIKVTTKQILEANPGLKADKLKVGQKIFIPAPQS
jgi:LysM repeat protein